jgi:protein AroM
MTPTQTAAAATAGQANPTQTAAAATAGQAIPTRIVGAVTVGQSPRDDVLPEIMEMLPAGTPVIERGALDELDDGELDELRRGALAKLAPAHDADVLVTRLRDGQEVTVGQSALLPLLQRAVDGVVQDGADLVAMLCTDSLPGLRCARPVLMPGALVRQLVLSVARGASLGVIVPAADQVPAAESEWAAVSGTLHVRAASPYGSVETLASAAKELAGWHPDLVVLDCLGFSRSMQSLVRESVHVPVILPRTTLAGAIAALL